MNQHWARSIVLFALALLAIGILAIACSDGTVATATPTPSAAHQLWGDGPRADWFNSLSASEQACIEREHSSYREMEEIESILEGLASWSLFMSGEEEEAYAGAMKSVSASWAECIDPKNDATYLSARLQEIYGTLSPETERCIRETMETQALESPRLRSLGYEPRWPVILQSHVLADSDCVTETEKMEAEVMQFAEQIGGLTQEERDCLHRVAVTEDRALGFDFESNMWPPVFDCVNVEKIAEKEAADYVGSRSFGTTKVQQDCVRDLYVEFYSARPDPAEGTDMTDLFLFWFFLVLNFECFTDDQLRPIFDHLDAREFECVRKSYETRLRVFREFGVVGIDKIPDGISPEGRAVIESYKKALDPYCSY